VRTPPEYLERAAQRNPRAWGYVMHQSPSARLMLRQVEEGVLPVMLDALDHNRVHGSKKDAVVETFLDQLLSEMYDSGTRRDALMEAAVLAHYDKPGPTPEAVPTWKP